MNIDTMEKAMREAMDTLQSQMSMGAIGEYGPSIEEMDAFVEKDHGPYGENADYHAAQLAWRTLEKGLL